MPFGTIDHRIETESFKNAQGNTSSVSRVVDQPRGRHATTHYRVLGYFDKHGIPSCKLGFSLVQCRIETGRTHQIRIHMQSIGHPLVGDFQYAKKSYRAAFEATKKFLPRVFLHSFQIALPVPRPGADPERKQQHLCRLPADLVYGLNNLVEDEKMNRRLEKHMAAHQGWIHQVFGSPDLHHVLSEVTSLSAFRDESSQPSASSKRARHY